MIKVTIENTDSLAPQQVYYLSEGSVRVARDTAEALNPFSELPFAIFTGAIKITVEGTWAKWETNRRSEMDFREVFRETLSPDNTESKSPPNWREAFEQVLAKGCAVAEDGTECLFCRLTDGCADCPVVNRGNEECCEFWSDLDSSLRRAIFRHVLAAVKDFTDVSEIRERIAEMLDDPEKFLGKAEPEKEYEAFHLMDSYEHHGAPKLKYAIQKMRDSHHHIEEIVIACRDEETRDRVLEFLNG